jgi:outer membrane receptor protein involved in Fe transport
MRGGRTGAALLAAVWSVIAHADEADGGRPLPVAETTVTAAASAPVDGRAGSEVRRSDLDRRLPRSAPDAMRFEPGVFIQQTGHGQGSAFIRGLTGQQTLLLFDGIRLNNSTYRQGPNQYFFTLDSQTLGSIEVIRGGASTEFGSDALGGVISARPLEPSHPDPGLHPRVALRGTSADRELGGRVQLELNAPGKVGFLGGAGARRVGLLQAAGPVLNPLDGAAPEVPRFEPDGRTQLGTGFDEVTADGRLVYRMGAEQRLTFAGYTYRQFRSPRTDQCPPPAARYDECLRYDEQFRTLVYGAWEADPWHSLRVTLSWQQQHERRTHERPASFVSLPGRDEVETLGVTARASTPWREATPWLSWRASYGADTYFDRVQSRAWIQFTDVVTTLEQSRGQYLDGSRYLYGGAFLDPELRLFEALTVRVGGRVSWIAAHAPQDVGSGSVAIDRRWFPLVGHAGLEWRPLEVLSILAHFDRSFRAPNLDDLTSRQQTGPGFQFENPALQPEGSATVEAGLRWRSPLLSAELWIFRTLLDGAVGKSPRASADCPPQTPQCSASWFRYQLVNAREAAELVGVELSGRARLPLGFTARAGVSWVRGEGPNLADPPSDPAIPYEPRVPLSRVPPLNGSAEVTWNHTSGLSAGAGLRWATLQDRLAIADRSDARIPLGGTPGFTVVDLRLSHQLQDRLSLSGVLENLFDARFRYHGSSVNGPGRGVMLQVAYSPF